MMCVPSNATTPSFPATSMPCKVKGCEKIRPAFDRAYDSITVSRDSPQMASLTTR